MIANNARKRVLAEMVAEGRLTPSELVRDASDPTHPLHDHFDWDDASAAHKHRLNQAARLIKSIKFTVHHHDRELVLPEYTPDINKPHHYEPVRELARQRDKARQALREDIQRTIGHLRRSIAMAATLNCDYESHVLSDVLVKLEALVEDWAGEVRSGEVRRG